MPERPAGSGSDNIEVEQDEASLIRVGGKEQLVEFAGDIGVRSRRGAAVRLRLIR